MTDHVFKPSRRIVVAGLAASMSPLRPRHALTEAGPAMLSVRAAAGTIGLEGREPQAAVWNLTASSPMLRVRRGAPLSIALANALPAPTILSWRASAALAGIEPLLTQQIVKPNATSNFTLPTARAGTGFCDIRLLADGAAAPTRPLPLIVDESEPVSVDRDEVFLVEDWRVTADGTALPPGVDPKGAETIFTVNGAVRADIPVRGHQRIRLRLINGCQRMVIAVKIADVEVRVMAIDGQPAEPFPARNGAVVLPPGGRADVFVDIPPTPGATKAILLHDGTAARPVGSLVVANEPPVRQAPLPPAPPLPSNGLSDRLDLKGAVRVELPLDGVDWVLPQKFSATTAPAFQTKAGRTVVLALANRASVATVFHLHGHCFRLLDRLDDGWKPYWLDTLALEPGQTQRIAFAAETAGRFLIESMATDWAAPRRVRWYDVR